MRRFVIRFDQSDFFAGLTATGAGTAAAPPLFVAAPVTVGSLAIARAPAAESASILAEWPAMQCVKSRVESMTPMTTPVKR